MSVNLGGMKQFSPRLGRTDIAFFTYIKYRAMSKSVEIDMYSSNWLMEAQSIGKYFCVKVHLLVHWLVGVR